MYVCVCVCVFVCVFVCLHVSSWEPVQAVVMKMLRPLLCAAETLQLQMRERPLQPFHAHCKQPTGDMHIIWHATGGWQGPRPINLLVSFSALDTMHTTGRPESMHFHTCYAAANLLCIPQLVCHHRPYMMQAEMHFAPESRVPIGAMGAKVSFVFIALFWLSMHCFPDFYSSHSGLHCLPASGFGF